MNLIKPQVNAKCGPDTYGPASGRASQSTGMLGTCTHYSTPPFHFQLNQEMVNLLHSSATIAEVLSGVLIAFKVSSWLLAQEKVALRQETGWTLPGRSGWTVAGGSPGGECSPQPSPDWAILLCDFIHCSPAACEESGGVGSCLLAYKCGLKKQSTEWFFK